MTNAETKNQKHLVLLGASVGKAWNVLELPERIGNEDFSFEYIGCYQFDKSAALDHLLKRNENKPDAIILKECAAYFPGDIDFTTAKSFMKTWIIKCQVNNIVPIPATVVPVTHSHDHAFKTRNPLKRAIKNICRISMKTRMQRIIEYNDWINEYAKQQGLVVLDLETPLRRSVSERYLRDELTSGDGLHLNEKAYEKLDRAFIETLGNIRIFKGN